MKFTAFDHADTTSQQKTTNNTELIVMASMSRTYDSWVLAGV